MTLPSEDPLFRNGYAIGGLLFGVTAALAWIPLLYFSLPIAIAGIALSWLGMSSSKALAIPGLVLSIGGAMMATISYLAFR